MSKQRVQCFIDGFNIYHAIDSIRPSRDDLKWLNLRTLAEAFITPSTEMLNEVYYFSAYAWWLPEAMIRHREYVNALKEVGVTPILGNFKEKETSCHKCGARWIRHEEKESDVSMAVWLVDQAHKNGFDKALVVTADSDLCPPIRIINESFPKKEIVVLVPPNRYNISREIRSHIKTKKIKQKHLKRNLLDETIYNSEGEVIARRPAKYSPQSDK